MSDVIKIIKSLENSGVLIYVDEVTETVTHEKKKKKKKKKEGEFLGTLLAPLATSLVQSVISAIVKSISGRGVRRAERLLSSFDIVEITNYFKYEPRFNSVFSKKKITKNKW